MSPSGQLHKDTLLTAFRAMLLDDPETVTVRHLELLLRQFSPDQIIESAEQILSEQQDSALVIKKLKSILALSDTMQQR